MTEVQTQVEPVTKLQMMQAIKNALKDGFTKESIFDGIKLGWIPRCLEVPDGAIKQTIARLHWAHLNPIGKSSKKKVAPKKKKQKYTKKDTALWKAKDTVVERPIPPVAFNDQHILSDLIAHLNSMIHRVVNTSGNNYMINRLVDAMCDLKQAKECMTDGES